MTRPVICRAAGTVAALATSDLRSVLPRTGAPDELSPGKAARRPW